MKGNLNTFLEKKKEKRIKRSTKDSLELLVLAIPCIVWFFIFSYLPMGGICMAFQKFSYKGGVFGSPFVGFDNFEFLFKSMDAYRIVRNTICYNLVFIVVGTVFAVIVAIGLDATGKKWKIKLFQSVYIVPNFISWVVVGFIATALLDFKTGFFNSVLRALGQNPVTWYQTKEVWPGLLVIFQLWKTFGYNSIIYLGVICGIDPTYYEAATIDGCNGWQKTRHITLPLLLPTVVVLTIMSIGSIMRADFGLFYYIPNNTGMLYEVTDVIDSYVFRALTQAGNVSVSAAIGLFQSVVGLILVLITNKIANKVDKSYALM